MSKEIFKKGIFKVNRSIIQYIERTLNRFIGVSSVGLSHSSSCGIERNLITFQIKNKSYDNVENSPNSLPAQLNRKIDIHNILNPKTKKNIQNIAEMKKHYFTFLKSIRIFSFYSVTPYNIILFLTNLNNYTFDAYIFHMLLSNFCLFIPYFLTENWVIRMSHDKESGKLHLTKMNIYCKENTTIYDEDAMVKIHKKNNMRVFTLFKNKHTNEHFSLLNICEIKDHALLDSLIPEKIVNPRKKNKENSSQRLIDQKINKKNQIFYYVKLCFLYYFILISIYAFFRYRKMRKQSKLIIVE
jgi:hypothetical protein